MGLKLGTECIRAMAAFENITRVQAKDCIVTEDCVFFLVDPEKVGLTIGKNGAVIKEVRKILGKIVKVFGYFNSPEEFIKNIIPNVKSIDIHENVMTISIPMDDRVNVIGKNGRNINAIKKILKRHFSIENLRLR